MIEENAILRQKIPAIEERLGYRFGNTRILLEAFTHRSALNESTFLQKSNERLEYLGDAVLELIIRTYLVGSHEDLNEGQLSQVCAGLVDQKACQKYLNELGLESELLTGAGVSNLAKSKVFANLFEAVMGAIFLDGGYQVAERFFLDKLESLVKQEISQLSRDPKTELQEVMQQKHQKRPEYKMLEEIGPDHNRKFVVGVYFEEKLLAVGEGRSKREAEKAAAKLALEEL